MKKMELDIPYIPHTSLPPETSNEIKPSDPNLTLQRRVCRRREQDGFCFLRT